MFRFFKRRFSEKNWGENFRPKKQHLNLISLCQISDVLSLMQSVMGITTLMISQIPEQTDAESFRWNCGGNCGAVFFG